MVSTSTPSAKRSTAQPGRTFKFVNKRESPALQCSDDSRLEAAAMQCSAAQAEVIAAVQCSATNTRSSQYLNN